MVYPSPKHEVQGNTLAIHRGRQRVVALEDTSALYRAWTRDTLSWAALGLLAGATLIAAGFGARNQAARLAKATTRASLPRG